MKRSLSLSLVVGKRQRQCAELVYDDAKGWLERYNGPRFDVMIFDLSDPLDDGPATMLYTVKFYEFCLTKLADDGVFVTQVASRSLCCAPPLTARRSQAGPAGFFTKDQVFTAIVNTVRRAFAHTKLAISHVPSYSDLYGFVFASRSPLVELESVFRFKIIRGSFT